MEHKHYTRLSIEDRETISRGLSANLSYAEIARETVDLRRPSLEKIRITMADMPIAAAQLSARPSSLWADDAVVNGSCFKTVGLSVTSIEA